MRPKTLTAIAVCALALTGCAGADPEPVATVTVTAAPSPEAETLASAESVSSADDAEQAFLAEFEQRSLNEVDYSDKELISFGMEACEYLKDGELPPLDLVGSTVEDQGASVFVVSAAETALCPTS